MNLRLPSLLLALGLGLAAPLAAAETPAPAPAPGAKAQPGPRMGADGQPGRRALRERPESFTEETVRKTADGRVIKRQIEQKFGEGSFYRKEVTTNPEGKTATRTVTATFNKDKKTWTRKVEGVDFDGSTWSRSNEGRAEPHDEDDGPQPRKGKKGA
jgi:hypothetical protein